jgi:hypothetical protein
MEMFQMRKPSLPRDAQERHDLAFQPPKLDEVADAATLEASLKQKNGLSGEPPPANKPFDPLASAKARHPGLSSDEATEFAKNFGF